MKVLGTRVLVQITKAERHQMQERGIVIPDSVQIKLTEGVILEKGNGRPDDLKGNLLLDEVKVGDTVRVDPNMGSQGIGPTPEEQTKRIFSIHDVLAVIEPVANAA